MTLFPKKPVEIEAIQMPSSRKDQIAQFNARTAERVKEVAETIVREDFATIPKTAVGPITFAAIELPGKCVVLGEALHEFSGDTETDFQAHAMYDAIRKHLLPEIRERQAALKEQLQPYDLSFSDALAAIKAGHRAARDGWNGKGMFVFLVPGSQFRVNREPLLSILGDGTEVTYRPHIDICQPDGSIGVWQPSMGDVMAEDWRIVE